jgi:hypothetical protein
MSKKNRPTISKLDYIRLNKDNIDQAKDINDQQNNSSQSGFQRESTQPRLPNSDSSQSQTDFPQKDKQLMVKKFVETDTPIRPKKSFPSFLNNFSQSNQNKQEEPRSSLFGGTGRLSSSIGNIFAQDKSKLEGIQRVFRKTLLFLTISLLSFGLLVFASLNVFVLPWYITLISALFFIATTNIFFVILADRSYMWLGAFGNVGILVMAHFILGQLLNPITLVIIFIFMLLYILAYLDLERMQMGTRLFNIHSITQQAVSVLVWACIFILSLGLFNSVVSEGSEAYFDRVLLQNEFVFKNVILGRNPKLSVNKILEIENPKGAAVKGTTSTVGNFLELNYKSGEVILSETEKEDIQARCFTQRIVNCDEEIGKVKIAKLNAWLETDYPELGLQLSDPLTSENYRKVVTGYYKYRINSLEQSSSEGVQFLNSKYILPGALTLVVLGGLSILFLIWTWLVGIVIFILWRILRLFGFAKIEVENVEAEIVSI